MSWDKLQHSPKRDKSVKKISDKYLYSAFDLQKAVQTALQKVKRNINITKQI